MMTLLRSALLLLLLAGTGLAQGSAGFDDEIDSGSYKVNTPQHPNINGATVNVPFNDPNTPEDDSETITVTLQGVTDTFRWDANRNGYVNLIREWKVIYYNKAKGDFEVRHYDDPTTDKVNEGDDPNTDDVEETEYIRYSGELTKT